MRDPDAVAAAVASIERRHGRLDAIGRDRTTFDPAPSLRRSGTVVVETARTAPAAVGVIGIAVGVLGRGGPRPFRSIGQLDQARLFGAAGVHAEQPPPHPRMAKFVRTEHLDAETSRRRDLLGALALVGKGIMYDSGGISLKPTDPMHAAMKMDMSGAAAVLSTMSALSALDCPNEVTGLFMTCTDNMPSGSAMKLGDVLHIHGGTTVEVHNTDADGRLVLADGLALAAEERPDAIVDIATLTRRVCRRPRPRIRRRVRERPAPRRPGHRRSSAD